jgi:hypothetical protein
VPAQKCEKSKPQSESEGSRGGTQLIVDQVGDLGGFFEVYASEHTRANVLSFADVEDKYVVTYKEKEAFMVQLS